MHGKTRQLIASTAHRTDTRRAGLQAYHQGHARRKDRRHDHHQGRTHRFRNRIGQRGIQNIFKEGINRVVDVLRFIKVCKNKNKGISKVIVNCHIGIVMQTH